MDNNSSLSISTHSMHAASTVSTAVEKSAPEVKTGTTSNHRSVELKDSSHYEALAYKSEMKELISDFGGDKKAVKQFLSNPENRASFEGAVEQKAQTLKYKAKTQAKSRLKAMKMPDPQESPKSLSVSTTPAPTSSQKVNDYAKKQKLGNQDVSLSTEDSPETGTDSSDLTEKTGGLSKSDDSVTTQTRTKRSRSLSERLLRGASRTGREFVRHPSRLVKGTVKSSTPSEVSFKESLSANNDKKGLRLDTEQLEKFPGEIKDIVQNNRKDWKKGKTDTLQTFDTCLGKTEVQYIAKTNTVIVRLGELGKGTYKTTSLAMDYDTGTLYASSKEAAHHESVDELMSDDTQYLSQFERRELTADTIKSNLLIPQHTFINNEDSKPTLYQLSKLCEGGELSEYNESSFSDRAKIEITSDLLDCLKELHEAGMKHNDISGNNILMREKGSGASLMDFDESSQIMGGPKSQLRAQKSDVGQLGVSLYQVFVGCSDEILQTMMDGEGMSQLDPTSMKEAALANKDNYSKLPEPKNSFEQLLLDMMNPDVDSRPSVSEAMDLLQVAANRY